MKPIKTANKTAILYCACACIFLFSCKTTNSAAKPKEESQQVSQNSDAKALTYRNMAEAFTKQCPIKVDDTTDLIRVDYREDPKALAYTYLFTKGVHADMDEQRWAITQQTVKTLLIENLKTNNLLYQIRADGLGMIYIFKDKNDKELFTITLEPGEF